MKIKSFENSEGKDIFTLPKSDLIGELVANKKAIIKTKKITHSEKSLPFIDLAKVNPAYRQNSALKEDELIIEVVGSLAGYMDYDDDVILPGAYNKSIQDRGKEIPFLRDHLHTTEGIVGQTMESKTMRLSTSMLGITSDVKECEAFVQKVYLNEKLSGSVMTKYKMRLIRQHSLGLKYINIELAVNDADFKEEYAVWTKYYPQVINKEKCNEMGYFFAIKEIAVMENSAVLFAANEMTPTLDIEMPAADSTGKGLPLHAQTAKKMFYQNIFKHA